MAWVNLTLDTEVAATARALGLNMSRLAEAAISNAARLEKNRAALAAYSEEVSVLIKPFVVSIVTWLGCPRQPSQVTAKLHASPFRLAMSITKRYFTSAA
jgi:antitoxin CcdA